MSSYNDYIKFSLDIKDSNLIFEDYFYKLINQTKYKIYKAIAIQLASSECGFVDLLHNVSSPIIIRLYKQRVLCKDCHKWSMA